MSNSIWRKKPLSAYEADVQKSELKRVLGRWALTSLGIGAVIGGGVFVLTGTGANDYAGPALGISFIIAGIGCMFAALCYGEFASMLPVEGSAYAYSYGTIGEIFAWIIGWSLILEYAMGASTVAVSWSGYFGKLLEDLFQTKMPYWLFNDPFTASKITEEILKTNPGYKAPVIAFNLPAMVIAWLVTYILVKGVKEAANVNNLIVILKVAAVLFVIVVGAFYVNTENWIPFIPDEEVYTNERGKTLTRCGWQGVVKGAASIFFAYIGFDAVSTQAGEAINPRKDMPFAIITSLLICTVLYVGVSFVLTGMINYADIVGPAKKAPIAYAFANVGVDWAVWVVTIAATAGLVSVMLVMLLGQTRIFLGMSKDGLLPGFFKEIHPKFKTPYKSTILVGGLVSIIASLSPINNVAELTNIGTLLAFAMVCGAVWILRVREPNIERPFKTPFLPVVASLGILVNTYLILNLNPLTHLVAAGWILFGLIIYFLYSKRRSNLEIKEPA